MFITVFFTVSLTTQSLASTGADRSIHDSKSQLQSWVNYTDKILLAPESLLYVKYANGVAKTAGAIGAICETYLPESMVPTMVSSVSCLSGGLPQYISKIGEVSGSFMPYVFVYKGIKSFGTLLLDNSSDSGEDVLNIINGYTAAVALRNPNIYTFGMNSLTTLACTIYGICKKKPVFDLIKTNYYSLANIFQDDFNIENDDSTYLTAQATVDTRDIDGKFLKVSEFLTTADLTFALGVLEINDNEFLKEVMVDTHASRALIKLKGTWVQGKYDDFFASHTSLNIKEILDRAAQSAVIRAVYNKFGRSGLTKLRDKLPTEEDRSITVKGGNTKYSSVYDIKILDKNLKKPVYLGDIDKFVFEKCHQD